MPERTEKKADLQRRARLLAQHKELATVPVETVRQERFAVTLSQRTGVDLMTEPEWFAGCECGWKADGQYTLADARIAWAEHALLSIDASSPGVGAGAH